MIQFLHGKYTIEVFDDASCWPGSADNPKQYNKEYQLDDGIYKPSSQCAVRVLSNTADSEITSCILFTSGGATSVHDHSALIHDDKLILAVGPFMVSLLLPTLELYWKTQTDDATCFGIYHSEKYHCYISHGELEVARVSYAGEKEWTQAGADNFTNGFIVTDDCVRAVDWNNDVYVWDIADGRPVK